MPDRAPRLGDVIDDYCPRCRLLLNHDVTSLFGGEVAKVTCRTCHNPHDYRHAQVPTRRKAAKQDDKKSLLEQVLASLPKPPEPPPAPPAPLKKKRDLWAEVERIKGQKKD
jgi:Zn-finger nucleic acid-binding protein